MYHHDDHYHDQYSLYTCVYWHEAVPSEHLSVNWVGFAPPPPPFNSVLRFDSATQLRPKMC